MRNLRNLLMTFLRRVSLSADQKDTFKDFVREKVRDGKKANREAREARKKALEEMSEETKAAFQNMKFYKFYPAPTPDSPDVSNFKGMEDYDVTGMFIGRVLKSRYFNNRSFMEAELGSNPSWVWRSTWGSKKVLTTGIQWSIGNGEHVCLGADGWGIQIAKVDGHGRKMLFLSSLF
ncbi:hypothetical protein RHMOL_Rhmol10G0129300 [Rhododendron molle]|uniref:Uncharacterized protein n=1 Tax=Rhododendron molle TaxID=49168 RepID=A0ACC0M1D4_RHOML|nr:hypothetical protein RHMOL_Rhmol10G0129300 [Rhododendron molle]